MDGKSDRENVVEIKPFHKSLFVVVPTLIKIEQVDTPTIVKLQKRMSKAVWRPAPGRKLGFLVRHGLDVIGLIFLASPVINLKVRDEYLKLNKNPSEKGKELRSFMDMSVCVAAQPIAWYWNLGKLVALIAPTLGDYVEKRYPEDEFKGITTTSLWGRGSQYNRIYKFLGYSKGYGHYHITDEKYKFMIEWLKENGHEVPSCKFGAGSNPRMRRIQAYIKASGEKISLKHGSKRGVYYHERIPSEDRQKTIDFWYERWGKPRFDRKKNETPPYLNGLA